ncbi:hypothetical protein Prum_089220 [Phytohabitans rumicis]|uniref:Uncharacterized protein n=1 Tax=Phytohabitans rumicis TaxID=1076125 RepID=A0A6V8LIA3_9ACTN|nr:hypothetical protein Prum_089220 [Phytohabitans rumicis]
MVGGTVGAVGDAVVGPGVGELTEPVQAVPLSENAVGTGLALLYAPTNPIAVDPPVPSDPFQLMLAAVTRAADCVQVALQPWVTRWPVFGKSNVSVQLVTGEPRLVIETLLWNPPGHWLCTVYATVHPVAANAGGVIATKPAAASVAAAPHASRA